eukprot:scaffold269867_cov33-Prasinocladus_malaysianus.AAC.1
MEVGTPSAAGRIFKRCSMRLRASTHAVNDLHPPKKHGYQQDRIVTEFPTGSNKQIAFMPLSHGRHRRPRLRRCPIPVLHSMLTAA